MFANRVIPTETGARGAVAVCVAILGLHGGPAVAGTRFSDQTTAAGVVFEHGQARDHRSGPMGGGGAIGDFNGDGYPDLFVVGGGDVPDALFINEGDGTFSDRAREWGLVETYRGTGATVGDYDHDGDDDLYVTSMGDGDRLLPRAGDHRLYRNDGGYFSEVAEAAGVNRTSDYPDGYGAAFGDYDLDGDLDLFVAGWHGIGSVGALGSRLFRNRGDGTFEDVTESADVMQRSTHAFGAIFADMNGDRWPELLVAGDFGTSRYYRNNRDGTFTELDPGSGEALLDAEDPGWSIGKAHNAMGAAVADLDGDLRPDWFVTAIWPAFQLESSHWGNGLYLNRKGHRFEERSARARLSDGGWGWGVATTDFDHDGRIDVFMTNGWPDDDVVTGESFDREPSDLFVQRRSGAFVRAGDRAGLEASQDGRGLLTLDYDRDGDLDVVVLSNRDELRLYRNELIPSARNPRRTNWLQLSLDTSTRADLAPRGLGSQVSLWAGGRWQRAWMTGGGTYLGAHEQTVHFGLGRARRVGAIVVRWADGRRTVLWNVRANQHIELSPPTLGGVMPNGKWRRK